MDQPYEFVAQIDADNNAVKIFSTLPALNQSPPPGCVVYNDNPTDGHALLPDGSVDLQTTDGVYLWRWDGSALVHKGEEEIEAEREAQRLAQIRAAKPAELYAACEADFGLNGFAAQTSKGLKTFTLDLYDQSNLQFIGSKIALSAASKFPYHAKGEHKEIWSAEDMMSVIAAGEVYKTIRLVYLDMLFQWLERAEPDELDGIVYIPCERNEEVGQNLPSDLLAKMWALLAETQA